MLFCWQIDSLCMLTNETKYILTFDNVIHLYIILPYYLLFNSTIPHHICHDKAEILLKLVLSTNQSINQSIKQSINQSNNHFTKLSLITKMFDNEQQCNKFIWSETCINLWQVVSSWLNYFIWEVKNRTDNCI